uniref:Reverse transcriptase domain-containing protein n=1 Tax=Oryzias latipes TaxID=8090 RepID=A0A3B3HCT2_ORYLA
MNELILDNNLDCLLLTETWLGTDAPVVLTEASPLNFNFLFSTRGDKKGGGTASIARGSFATKTITLHSYSSFEHHAFSFNSPSSLCVTVYRPPKPPSCFIQEFSEFLSVTHSKYSRVLITGDFNLHVDKDSDAHAKEFLNLLHCMDFTQHVTQPTHGRGRTLDLVITYGLSCSVSSVVDMAVSDHYCIFFNITSFTRQEAPVRTVRKRYITPDVAANVINILHQTPAHILPASCDFMVEHFNNKLQSAIDVVAPLKTKMLKTKATAPWKNEPIRALKRECRRAERKWRKTKLTVHRKIFKEQQMRYSHAIKKARTLHFSNLILQNKNDLRVLFKTIDSLTKRDSQRSSIAASDAVCESFADHFRSKINAIRSSLLTQKGVDFNESIALYLSEETLESFVLVDAVGLGQVFSQLKPTTCLLDPIPTSLLKTFYDFFESELLNIVNYSLQTGVFPAAFKTAVVRPLLKKSHLDPYNYNNYRPVSNLPFLSKMIEKTVLIQFNEFLNRNNIFEKYQSGFRTNYSTETAHVKIVNDIRCNLDCQKLSVLGLLDLSAAFDTVDHSILLNRPRGLGISGTVLKWFYSYLTDQSFYVSMDTCSSRVFDINCGVPQGSILGPLLFNLYMLPLGDVIRRHGVCFHSYADDTQLYIAVSPDDEESVNTLLKCILDIESWMAENFLQLNQDKTEVLVIGSEDKREIVLSKLKNYKTSQCVRNLGVIFDSEMNFIPQIKNITNTGFYHLKNISRVRPFLSCQYRGANACFYYQQIGLL